jgi:urease accessory protein
MTETAQSPRRVASVVASSHWPRAQQQATVTLPYAERHRRRRRMRDDHGHFFLLDLPQATQLGAGDGLALVGGGFIEVKAADEDVLDIACRDAAHASRIAWHVGNRHTPLQVLDDGRLRIQYDHVLADMLTGLGAETARLRAPFGPEPGAYAAQGGHHGHHHE